MGQAPHVREFALERVDMRTQCDDPVGIERVEEKPAFLRPGVRRREVRALAHLSHMAAFPYPCPAPRVPPPGSSRSERYPPTRAGRYQRHAVRETPHWSHR